MNEFVILGDGLMPGGSEEARRRIRSVATRFSHHSGERKPKSRTGEGVEGTRRRKTKTKKKVIKEESREEGGRYLGGLAGVWQLPDGRVEVEGVVIKREGSGDVDDEQEEEEGLVKKGLLYVRTPSPIRTAVGVEADDPFETYPVPAEPFFSRLLFHLNGFMLRGWASLPMRDEERDEGLMFVQRQSREDASYFYMNLLSIAGDLTDKNQVGSSIVPWLTAKVVASVNEAVGDRRRSLSAATIMTVGRIMLHEMFLGDPDIGQNVHRRAFARMLVLAGGSDALNLPEVVRYSWAWTERLLARKTGVAIGQMEPALLNDRTFQRGRDFSEDVKVLAGYHEKREWKAEEFGDG